MRTIAVLAMIAAAATGCAPQVERSPVPTDRIADARIPGIEDARYWRGEPPENLPEVVANVRAQRRAAGIDGEFTVLALSGGADNGAFGAGLLAAWTDRGDRPEFDVVTGVSTGALTAPFVFLGPEWDDELKRMYGGFPPEQIFVLRSLLSILPSVSAADPAPLEEIIRGYVDEDFLAAVAREHARGRRLIVQSTDLDAQEAVIWNMGAIANSGAPNAAELFADVLMASASVPGAFPPKLIEAEVDGVIYDEMHVDGGVVSESTVLSYWQADLDAAEGRRSDGGSALYVIRNGPVSPQPKPVKYDLLSIAGQSASTLIRSQGVGDLLTAYEVGQERGSKVYLT